MRSNSTRRAPARSLTRAEKTEVTQRALLDAAVKVIGSSGYLDASIAKITQQAEVAQGTFYNYFASQQELFDQLLPLIGQRLIDRIRENRREHDEPLDRERAGFETFFDFLLDVPEFYRLLTEAETFAPEAHRMHIENMVGGYVRTLRRLDSEGWLKGFEEREFEAIAVILIGIRHYLAMRYSYRPGSVHRLPRWVSSTYARILTQGLFESSPGKSRKKNRASARAGDRRSEPRDQPRIVQVTPGAAVVELDLDLESGESAHGVIANLAGSAASAALGNGSGETRHDISTVALSIMDPPAHGRLTASAEVEGLASVVRISVHQNGRDRQVGLAQITFALVHGSKPQPQQAQSVKKGRK